MQRPFPVLWLYGPSGIGKTTIAWELYCKTLSESGVALIETDMVRMCDPPPTDDPHNVGLIAENLSGILSNLRAGGVRGVVVTAVSATRRSVDAVMALVPEVSVTVCRLHANREEHARRYSSRGFMLGALQQHLADAAAIETSEVADLRVDITELAAPEAARAVLDASGWAPPPASSVDPPPPLPAQPPPQLAAGERSVPLIWLSGPRGAWTTAAGYRVAARFWRAGTKAAYVDLEQLGYLGTRDQARHAQLKAGNFAAVWSGFRSAGAEHVVISGSDDDLDVIGTYGHAAPDAAWSVYRLDARVDVLRERLVEQARSRVSVGLPNPLRDLSDEQIARVAEQIAAEWAAVEPDDRVEELRIDTSDRTLDEVVELVSTSASRSRQR
jgi:hypothetical protein